MLDLGIEAGAARGVAGFLLELHFDDYLKTTYFYCTRKLFHILTE